MSKLEGSRISFGVQDLGVRFNPDWDSRTTSRLAWGRKKKRGGSIWALRNVSFHVCEGESVGVLGRNGSGKSTLLRAIAGLQTPTEGGVLARSLPMLLGVSAALDGQLSGAENSRLGALALGISRNDLPDVLKEIEDFVELGDAFYRPMGQYSSGMAGRLRFAIAATVRPKILLVDEALATGDSAFRKKSEQKMRTLTGDAGTFLLVTHNAKIIESMCERAIWLHQGSLVADGDARTLSRAYRDWSSHLSKGRPDLARKVEQRLWLY
ncbi:ABC transporter ATP-binding protein [Corynebacterium sp. CCM 9185]|uniref:ABC transporter ATP-binding protein n=1 Tax=Corynebacterium marambiense TaxID=2765364 RepID=A0ABS0VWP9_9CORY|nr:ABC transporter ATP-binding protein [Corynebacterium marambiense]MBI9001193.1 ABC transporter ATP-binding protein [Corynebacterium marambiense]MCK7663752.1 ABC transporter ATP-binding protein [Corynebacterium marambiense]